MSNSLIWIFMSSGFPLFLAGLLGLTLIVVCRLMNNRRDISSTLQMLLPGLMLVVLSLAGLSAVFVRSRHLLSEFQNRVQEQIYLREGDLVDDLMAGRYLEIHSILRQIAKVAPVSQLTVYTLNGERIAQSYSKKLAESRVTNELKLTREDFDGSRTQWGSISYQPDMNELTAWVKAERAKWSWMSLLVVIIACVYAWFSAYVIQRHFIGLKGLLNELSEKIRLAKDAEGLASSLSEIKNTAYLAEERELRSAMVSLGVQLSDLHRRAAELEMEADVGRTLTQVVHDIRSPLSIFNSVARCKHGIDADKADLLSRGYERINRITTELLDKARRSNAAAKKKLVIDVEPVIDSLIEEKRMIFENRIDLRYTFSPEARAVRVQVCPVDLARSLSNIIDNAVEASGKDLALIMVNCQIEKAMLVVTVRDFGKGISADVIERLGERGLSFGKINGNGLGLSFAKKVMDSVGGLLQIRSSAGRGAVVQLHFPIVMRKASTAPKGDKFRI